VIPDLLVLAKAAKVATTQAAQVAQVWPAIPGHIPAQHDLLSWCQEMGPAMASLLVVAGVIYLAFGVYLYRALVTLNAAAVGIYVGGLVGAQMGNALAGAMVGGCAAAAIVWPGMKYAVATMGGLFGALLGASIWRSMGLEPGYAAAGAMIGLIFFGMLSFIVFRGSIMMYFSIQGAVMLVFGILGMMYKYQGLDATLTHNLSLKPFILPLCIFVPAVIGLIYQQTQYPAPAASSSSSGGKK
jgi:hypothetical protein